MVAHRRLHQHREVAPRGHRERDGRNLDAEDVLRARARGEPVLRLEAPALGHVEVHDEAQRLARAHRRLAEDRADVEHAQAAHLEEIAQHRRAAALDRLGPDLLQLDHVVGDQPVAARDELERELALADRGVAGDEDADLEHVEEDAVQRGDLAQLLLHVGPQHVDHVLAGLGRGEERSARTLGALRKDGGRRDAVGDDDAHGLALADAERGRLARLGLELLEIVDLAPPEHLGKQRMDEVQVPDEPDAGLVQHVAGEFARGAGLSRGPREPEALAALVKELLNAEPGHRATTR